MMTGCATQIEFVEVLVPEKPFVGTVKKSEILRCPEDVQEAVYLHLQHRDHYIGTLINVIKTHNEVVYVGE